MSVYVNFKNPNVHKAVKTLETNALLVISCSTINTRQMLWQMIYTPAEAKRVRTCPPAFPPLGFIFLSYGKRYNNPNVK